MNVEGCGWLGVVDAARYLSVSRKTLERLRESGEGPRFGRRGQIIRYRVADLDAWMLGEEKCPDSGGNQGTGADATCASL